MITRAFRSIGELEALEEDLSNTIGRQGIELARLDKASSRCIPSASDSYRTPEVAEEDHRLLGQVLPVLSLSAVGSPSGSRTQLVLSAKVLQLPTKNVVALRVPVRLLHLV